MDSFTRALGLLDPANRALLDLSLRRGMRPEDISELLGTDPESVIVAREQALEQLAAALGMGDVSEIDQVRARLAELPAEAWTPPARDDDDPVADERHDERAPLRLVDESDDEPRETEPAPPRRSLLRPLLAILALAAVVLITALAAGGGDDKQASSSSPSASKPAKPSRPAGSRHAGAKPSAPKPASPKPAKPAPPPAVPLAAVGGAGRGVKGTAALTGGGKRLRLDVSGLPAPRGGAAYQVWLYNSVIDAHSLVTVRGRNLALDLKLPANASRFHYVDVSLEPGDGNANHSGDSVLRVALKKLAR